MTNSDANTPQDSAENPEEGERTRAILTGSSYRTVVDQIITEAQERGDFDDLPGKGKPLVIQTNPLAGDKELAYKMLKDNDYTLPWIEDRNRMFTEIADYRKKIRRQWDLFGAQIKALYRAGEEGSAISRWRALMAQWQVGLETINRRIEEINTSLPVKRLEILKLSFDAELTRVGAKRKLEDAVADSKPPTTDEA